MKTPGLLRAAWLILFAVAPRADEPGTDGGFVYALPFAGTHRVSQTEGRTHHGPSKFAIDFPMPRGTPVLAARAGVVVRVEEDFAERSKQEKADSGKSGKPNCIAIRHDDGTKAVYLHLSQGGADVEVGDRVEEGQRIGRSGNTGKSSGPHLHFAVFAAPKNGEKAHTIALKFKTAHSESIALERGKKYTSARLGDGGMDVPQDPAEEEGRDGD